MNTIQNVLKTLTKRSRFAWTSLTLATLMVAAASSARADQLAICDENSGNHNDSAHPMYRDFVKTLSSGQCVTADSSCWTGPNWNSGLTYTGGRGQTCRNGSTNTYYIAVLSYPNLKAARAGARQHWYTLGVIYNVNDVAIESKAGPADSLNWSPWMVVSSSADSFAAFGFVY